ncbi:enoyl-CoA delta isomerase 2-like [Teleopsis dalmanni]|uniref:enoyl-CoA delta isomerase 2-like n=1 Tax=Teleopsis dalmanni TaxID=139649 RepID=UPI0018CDF38C|nr:enoyl-CoA delta isomerase 2-like [Teleopsis dalmanni]
MYEGCAEVLVEKQDKILIIKFNNPRKKNSLNQNAYSAIGRIFRQAANDETLTTIVVTGTGDYFSSGNDLSQSPDITDVDEHVTKTTKNLADMLSAVIDCPKIIIALVNGPSIGIGATLTGLCDIAWCTENAYFLTPFTQLGIVPEAASSYLFPHLLGRSKASEMLLCSEKMTASEAYHFGFVSKIFKSEELDSIAWPKIRQFSELPPESVRVSKQLLRINEVDSTYKAVRNECNELKKRFSSEEFMNAIIQFATRKRSSKL